MKRLLILNLLLVCSLSTWAQKRKIQDALISLKDKDYKQATAEINEAVDNPDTKEDPKAWFVRGNIYMSMQSEEAYKNESPYREAAKSYMEVVKLKPTYEKEAVNRALMYTAQVYYNDAVNAYNSKSYDEAVQLAQKTIDIERLEEGARFASNKMLDTIANRAATIAAYSAYYGKKYEEALPYLTKLKDSPIERDPNVYLLIADVYAKQNKPADQLAIIEEGRKAFPENANIRNEELNYYIKTGQQDVLMKKLEDAVAADPSNPVLQFNLANGYMGAAFPKDAEGHELAKPDNYSDLISKAEAAYMVAVKGEPNNAEYNYNTGVLYYNQATEVNQQMNDITGDSEAENKKYNQLKTQRNALFGQATPYFEKVIAQMEPKQSNLSPDDKYTYQSALVALKEIYAKQDNMKKSAEMKAKLEASRQ